MLDRKSQQADYDKYIAELWHLYDLAIKDKNYRLAFEVLGQIRLEVV